MNGVFYIGATGLDAQQRAIDAIAHNIANINTPAFKRTSVVFQALVTAAQEGESAATAPLPAIAPRGVAAEPVRVDFTQGQLVTSGESLDLAVRGDGFIPLSSLQEDGVTLWRGGRLRVNNDGALATETGIPLEAGIFVPDDAHSLVISSDGRVSAVTDDVEMLELGQIELAVPADTRELEVLGDGLYRLSGNRLQPELMTAGNDGAGTLAQGFIETANIELSRELVELMVHQRSYAANARLVQIGDELMALANGLKR